MGGAGSGVRGLSSLFFCYLPLQLIRAACRWKYSAAFSINQPIGSLWNVSAVSLVQGAINIGASTGFPVKLIGTPFKSVIWFQTICLFETIEVRRKRTENSLLGLGQSQIQTRMMFDTCTSRNKCLVVISRSSLCYNAPPPHDWPIAIFDHIGSWRHPLRPALFHNPLGVMTNQIWREKNID